MIAVRTPAVRARSKDLYLPYGRGRVMAAVVTTGFPPMLRYGERVAASAQDVSVGCAMASYVSAVR